MPESRNPVSTSAALLAVTMGRRREARWRTRVFTSVDVLVPQLGGRFQILRKVNSGGQGAVYEASHADPRGQVRTVAVKVFDLGRADVVDCKLERGKRTRESPIQITRNRGVDDGWGGAQGNYSQNDPSIFERVI